MNRADPRWWALLMFAAMCLVASRSHGQSVPSTDSCTEQTSGHWFKYGIAFTNMGGTSPATYPYASRGAACAAASASSFCTVNPGATVCQSGNRPWISTSLTSSNCRMAGGGSNSFLNGMLIAQEQTNPTVQCPADEPEECSLPGGTEGNKFTAGDWRDITAYPHDFCDATFHCKVKVTQAVDIGGSTLWTMERTAENCAAGAEEGPDSEDQVEGESCTPIGDGEYCASPSGDGDCGYLNDKFVCLSSVPEDGCKYMSDGSGVCQEDAGTPPQPDSGTPGTPATPDDTIQHEAPQASGGGGGGGCGAGCNYFDPATTEGSARDPTDTGGGTGGGSNVGGVGSGEDEGEDLGEITPPALPEPECTVEGCAQSFYARLAAAPIVAAIADAGDAFPEGACPEWTLEAFDEEYSLSAPACAIWDEVSPAFSFVFLAIWAWVATRIVLSA